MMRFPYDVLPDLDAYLARMGYTGSRELTRETLNALVYTHQCNVPFDSMDCSLYHKTVSLDTADLFEKVVKRHRGGFCFELNGIFTALLRTMGFDAVSIMCRITAGKTEFPSVRHRGVLVRMNGKRYFCDVGYGGAMAPFAVELSQEKQTFFGETYWVEPAEEGWLSLYRLTGKGLSDDGTVVGKTVEVIRFAPIAFANIDFQPNSVDCATREDSVFVLRYNAVRRTPNGYIALSHRDLVQMENGVKKVRPLTEEEILPVLKKYFGIEEPDFRK